MNTNFAESFSDNYAAQQESDFSFSDVESSNTSSALLDQNPYFSNFLISFWVFCNFLLFVAICQISYFQPVSDQLQSIFGIVFSIMALATVLYSLPLLIIQLKEDLKCGALTIRLTAAMLLVFAVALSIMWMLNDAAQFFDSFSIEFLIVISALVWTFLYLRELLITTLESRINHRFDKIFSTPRKIGAAGNSNHSNFLAANPQNLKVGDIVGFEADNFVPFDALIIEGHVKVYEREFSGTALWTYKQAGEYLWAGSIIVAGTATCRLESLKKDARIAALMPADFKISDRSPAISLFTGFCLFFACFSTIFWHDQGLTAEYLEPVLGSFIALGLLADWFWLKNVAPALALRQLFYRGIVLKKPALLNKLAPLKDLFVRVEDSQAVVSPKVEKLEVVDDRIDRQRLLAVLDSIFAMQADSPVAQAIVSYVNLELPSKRPLLSLEDYAVYQDGNMAATLAGIEFSVGTETFLIERGVHIISTQVKSKDPSYGMIYIAVQDQLVALLKMTTSPIISANRLQSLQKALNLKVHLSSSKAQEELDRAGKLLGLDLAYIHGAENIEQLEQRMASRSQVALVVRDARQYPHLSESDDATLTLVSDFDYLLFDPEQSDVNLMSISWPQMLESLLVLNRLKSLATVLIFGMPVLFLVMALAAFSSFVFTEITILLAGLAGLAGIAGLLVFSPDWRVIKKL